MAFRTKTKKKTASRFSHVAFQRSVKRASTYRRSEQGWKRDVQVLRALLARVKILPLMGAFVLLGILSVVVYYPPLLHVRTVLVTGLPPGWATEVQHQAERYLEDRRFFFLPGQHMALVDTRGLVTYLTTVNPHVQQVEAVIRRWPHTVEIRAVPRVPAYAWTGLPSAPPVLISNDGKVLPESERGDSVPLPLLGSALATTMVGGQAVGGELLRALEVVRTEFSKRTGLPVPAAVELIPLIAVSPGPSPSAVAPSSVISELAIPAISHELRVRVPPDSQYHTAEFMVFLDISTSLSDAFDRLRVLLERQPAERKADLYYVDLRFPARAYVCVRSASCATAEQVGRVSAPVVGIVEQQ